MRNVTQDMMHSRAASAAKEEIRVSLPDHTVLVFGRSVIVVGEILPRYELLSPKSQSRAEGATGSFQTLLSDNVSNGQRGVVFFPEAAGQCGQALELRRRFARRGTRLH